MDSIPQETANRQIARAAGTVMVAIVISQLVGLLAKSLTGQAFGTSPESEAFFAANRFAEILFNLVAGGALASAFVPTFTGLLANKDRPSAWRLASSILNLITIILTGFSILSAIFAPWIVDHILAPGFASANPAKALLTAELLRIQLISSVIFGISGLLMGILNAHQHFLLPALAPSMYSLGWIIGIVALKPTMGIHGLAWGVVIGSAMHLLIQLPGFFKLPERKYHPSLGLSMPTVREVARLMGPRLLGVAVVQLNFLLNTYLASLQPEGSLTGISLAFPLMLMPEAAIAQSIAIAALPTFSAQVALGKKDEMRSSLAATLRSVLLLAIPASLGLILLRKPLVALVYQYQAFDSASTELVAWALLWYAAGLVGHSVVEIVSRAFYALHDTKTPVFVGVGAMTLNLGFSLAFTRIFSAIGWMPHGGLALANSLATFLEMIALLIFMHRKLGGLEGASIWRNVGLISCATAVMAAALIGWMLLGQNMHPAIQTLGGVAIGVLVYGILVILMKIPEVRSILRIVRSRLHL
jgi:putative peptidoglycan lipid II flippase